MDNPHSDTAIKLAYAELSLGNYADAETTFKRIIERENHPAAWLGLGSTRLAYLFDCKNPDTDSANKLLKSSFQCIQEAKNLSPDDAETIESRLLSTCYNQLKVYYENIKKFYDLYKYSDKSATQTAYIGIAAGLLVKSPELNNTMSITYQSLIQQQNKAVGQYNLYVAIAVAVRNNTVASIEYAIPARDAFIREVSQLESELQWYVTDEKEKKRILAQQQAARQKQMQSSMAANTAKKESGGKTNYLMIVIWIILALVIIRVLQVIAS